MQCRPQAMPQTKSIAIGKQGREGKWPLTPPTIVNKGSFFCVNSEGGGVFVVKQNIDIFNLPLKYLNILFYVLHP